MQTEKRNDVGRTRLIVGSAIGGTVAVLTILIIFYSPHGGPSTPPMKATYVIYYGPLVNNNGKISDQAQKILDGKPRIAIVVYSPQADKNNTVSAVIKQFKGAGIKVLTYTWTKYGSRSLSNVTADINSQLKAGADGIFVDEVTNIATEKDFVYYSSIFDTVKAQNQTRIVVMNPGHYNVSQSIMGISDILSLEADWVYADKIPWMSQYSAERFMGVSSNEYCEPSCVSQSNAENLTIAAWKMGIGYHFSTDRYTDLPSWYSSYASDMQKIAAPANSTKS